MEHRNLIAEDFTIEATYYKDKSYCMEYHIVLLENINNEYGRSDFDRTAIVFDRQESHKEIYEIINNNWQHIQQCQANIDEIEKIFNYNIQHCAYTMAYHDDVRYLFSHNSSNLAEDIYCHTRLQLKVFEMIKHHFYDNDTYW